MAVALISPRLIEILDELQALLEIPDPRWSESMSRFSRRAAEATSTAQARELLTDIGSIYAGMGSFNDLVLQDRTGVLPQQRELSRLSKELYDEARAGIS